MESYVYLVLYENWEYSILLYFVDTLCILLSVNSILGNYMETKNTILSQKDLDLLESIVLHYGKIVSFEQIHKGMGESASIGAVRKHVAQMSKAGWLIRLKRGLYLVVTDISTLGFADVSDLVIAQTLNDESYISFESALQYHGMFDQLLKRIDAVTKVDPIVKTEKWWEIESQTPFWNGKW